MSAKAEEMLIIGGGVVLIAAAWWVYSKGVNGAAQSIASGAVDAVNGVVSGTVLGAGDALGLQRTNTTQCQADTAAGRTWDASFSCAASDFFKYLWNGNPAGTTGATGGW